MSRILFKNILLDLTKGRPFIFVLMSFNSRWEQYDTIKKVVEHALHDFVCLRADDIPAGGHDLLQKIHTLIDRSELVIADISVDLESGCCSPNVLYEAGYAVGRGREILLIADKKSEIPTDLKGLEVIRRDGSRNGAEQFRRSLTDHLRARVGSNQALLRDMLQADNEAPVYVVASPRYPGNRSRIDGQQYDRVTFGDNVGIRGLLAAFGSILGEAAKVELVSAQYCVPTLSDEAVNLYLIGSDRANPLTPPMLAAIQRDGTRRWEFRADEQGGPLVLCRSEDGTVQRLQGAKRALTADGAEVYVEDYGIIVRGPHPRHDDCSVLILAGAHSLGTAAACFAATRSHLIRQVRDRLRPKADLPDRDLTIWALVKGAANPDGMLDAEGVEIVDAGS